MIHISDHVMAIHHDRQRRFETSAREAAMVSQARRKARRFSRRPFRRLAAAVRG